MTDPSYSGLQIIERATALRILPKRDEHAHKWSVGGLLIVGGAPGYIGAPALSAMAAGRSGAGIVTLALPRSSVGPTATLVPEAVFLPLVETDASHGVQNALDQITPVAEKCRAMVIGPGLSRDKAAAALLAGLFGVTPRSGRSALGFGARNLDAEGTSEKALVGGSRPTLVDADALHWLAERESWWSEVEPHSLVLTPHAGELSALTGISADEIAANPAESVVRAADSWQQTVVLKAGKAWISDGTIVRTVAEAVPGLATAGTGDVLAGSIGAFLAQGLAPVDAATIAVYAGFEAARRLTAELSTLGIVAGDLPRAIATVLAELETESRVNR